MRLRRSPQSVAPSWDVLAGLSALAAAWLAKRIGLVNTMVFTHLPSNIPLILVPLMPNLPLATIVLLVRFSVSQMDVPPKPFCALSLVAPEHRAPPESEPT